MAEQEPDDAYHVLDRRQSPQRSAALDLIELARNRGARARFMIWEGQPGESIVDAAQAEGAGVIVVGSHNRGRVGRFFLGSVSEHVVKHASCPVLVVPPTDPDRAAEPDRPTLHAARPLRS